MARKKHLIVGLDPGTTTGVAILSLDGDVLGIYSSRTLNMKDLIHLVIGHGYPLIVATDVSPAPAFVDRMSRLFEAVLHEPPHSLTVEEKRELAWAFSVRFPKDIGFKNSHEKDAFAAAVKALESYADKFRWIDKKLSEKGLSNISERVKTLVVSGRSLSDSLKKVLSEGKPSRKAEIARPPKMVKAWRDETKLMRSHKIESSMIKNMEEEILQLKTELKERELKIKSLSNELERSQSDNFWEIVRSKEVDSRNKMILELKRSLSRVAADRDRLRRKIAQTSGSELLEVASRIEVITVVGDLSKGTIGRLGESKNSSDSRFLLVQDASGAGSSIAQKLREMKIEAIITDENPPAQAMKSLDSCGIPVIPRKGLNLLVIEGIALAERNSLDKALSRERKRMARRMAQAATTKFKKFVDDYRKHVTSEK